LLRKTLAAGAAVAALLLVNTAPSAAIVNGQPDGGAHPYVGQLLFYVPSEVDPRFSDPGAWFTCSGTLLDENTVLTAGHCTYGIGREGGPAAEAPTLDAGNGGTDVWISFEEEPDFGILPPSSGFVATDDNPGRYAAWAAALDASATWHETAAAYSHPQYDDAAFLLYDLGVLELEEPSEQSQYGVLPSLGLLDTLAKNKRATYMPVGYGLEKSGPKIALGGDTRRTAVQSLVNLNGVFGVGKGIAAKFSSNNGVPHTGGTCFGDSGGPIFAGTGPQIVAVTSFGISPTCTGSTGGYRVDQADDLDWLAEFEIG
jgi:hypothetical protein